jgi:glycogen synthase
MASHIQNGITGLLADTMTSESLATTIVTFAEQQEQYDSEIIKTYARIHFSPKLQAKTYTELYTSILS